MTRAAARPLRQTHAEAKGFLSPRLTHDFILPRLPPRLAEPPEDLIVDVETGVELEVVLEAPRRALDHRRPARGIAPAAQADGQRSRSSAASRAFRSAVNSHQGRWGPPAMKRVAAMNTSSRQGS